MNYLNNSIQQLTIFLNKLYNKEPFAIIRPGDGEYLIMTNKSFNTQDNWEFNGGSLQQDLLSVKDLIHGLDSMYVGIPCPDCQGKDIVEWYKNIWQLDEKHITYANIFCNKNWNYFINHFKTTKMPIYYIGPGTVIQSDINIKNMLNIDNQLVNNWDTQKETFTNTVLNWIDNIAKDGSFSTFVFSAGPISKYIIPLLYKKYPNNQFLDVGSSFDLLMKGGTNRGYAMNDGKYSDIVCSFHSGHTIITENDIKQFEGGWSYTPNEMRDFLKCINFRDSYKILEFGAGSSTKVLYDIIERFCYDIEYDTYENDINYKVIYKNVNTIMYDINMIDEVVTFNKKYDIIIVDGPHGVARAKWYEKIRNNIKYDTILLIDDYNHYIEFENELNRNFNYRILSRSDVPFVPNGEHSWRIITDITLKD